MKKRLISRKALARYFDEKKEGCKRHRWRVGAGIGGLINNKLETIGLHIWCERCEKVIKANYFPKYELNLKQKKTKSKRK